MNVNYHSRCCGLKEIDGLAHQPDPRASMLNFCKVIYPTKEENENHLHVIRQNAKDAGGEFNSDGNPVSHLAGFYWGQYGFNGAFQDTAQYSRFRHATFSEAMPNAPELIGSDRERNNYMYGRNFAAYILDNQLGTTVTTPREVNPNSGNLLQVWIWTIDHTALSAWYGKNNQKPKPKSKQSLGDILREAASTVGLGVSNG